MRKEIGVFIGAAALGSLLVTLHPGAANAQTSRPVSMEKSLLGVRLLQKYDVVLKKYGQPTRIHRIGQSVGLDYALDSRGNITGGIRGVYDGGESGGGAAGLAGGGAAGGPRAAGMAAPGGGPTLPGAPTGFSGAPGSMGGGRGMGSGSPYGGGRPGFASPGGGPGGGNPYGGGPSGMSGAPGSMGGGRGAAGMAGMPGMPGPGGLAGGLPGASAGGNTQDIPTFGASGGFVWVYSYPGKEIANIFIFNRDQRVVAICQFGRTGGQPTRKGVKLGAPVKSLYNAYGWPDSTETHGVGNMLGMFYNEKHHIQFDTLNNRVVGIVVALSEDMKIYRDGQGSRSGGGGAQMAGAGSGGAPAGIPGLPGGVPGGRGNNAGAAGAISD